jgi:hypothetical protein
MTVVLSRKGKEVTPTVSKLISRSNDIQIKSVKEIAKLELNT